MLYIRMRKPTLNVQTDSILILFLYPLSCMLLNFDNEIMMTLNVEQ